MGRTYALKMLARLAKERMNGELQNKKLTCVDNKLKIVSTEKDEALYKKVCELLLKEEIISNPLGKLIDQKVYCKLNAFQKEKYVFDLVEKYSELKARFEKEHNIAI